ncbi:MAG: HD domain-containing protein [Chlamydiales bacterium]|nr:HD domain-containing protein [Chlamydiales bacterium]
MKPNRKIYDPVHGFIHFNDLERDLIDSAPFQRLHYLHQLGIAYLVYPGANHTRFEHSLGVMELASRIFDRITSKETFSWKKEDLAYWRQIIRLAALCHDLGHLPFSHVAEKALLGKEGHEGWTLQIIRSPALEPIFEQLQKAYPDRDSTSDLLKMSIGEEKLATFSSTKVEFSPWERVLCQVITGDFFGADRIDYLLRDAQCTGVSYGLFDYHQLIEMLCIVPSKNSLELGIEENGIEACEALLLARHFMHKRVYQYSSVKAYSFHLSGFMKAIAAQQGLFQDLQSYLSLTENEILTALRKAADDPAAAGHQDAKRLSQRSERFRAVKIPDTITETDLQKIKKEVNVPDEAVVWELSKKKAQPYRLTFPVLTAKQTITSAENCSEIVIPLGAANWLYISPEHEEKFCRLLEML